MESYLNISNFQYRRPISKLRCSVHTLEIEKGGHKRGGIGILKHERICNICKNGQIEDEEHFLLNCQVYNSLKMKYKIETISEIKSLFSEENQSTLGKYLKEAFETREEIKKRNTNTEREGEVN